MFESKKVSLISPAHATQLANNTTDVGRNKFLNKYDTRVEEVPSDFLQFEVQPHSKRTKMIN